MVLYLSRPRIVLYVGYGISNVLQVDTVGGFDIDHGY